MNRPAPTSAPAPATASATAPTVTHYENFPVASWLCPPRLRPPIAAIYHFARTADDIADEGDASASERLAELQAYRAELARIAAGAAPAERWKSVFAPLQASIAQWQLPVPLLDDLLSAFMQDIAKTEQAATYADRAELLDYCRRSANPVGRLLLHLYGVNDATALSQSDAICSALQLINFWQDVAIDWKKDRVYLPQEDLTRFGVGESDIAAGRMTPAMRELLAFECERARQLMLAGAPLVHHLPGRLGWEIRLTVQGGLRILERIDAVAGDVFAHRPQLTASDWLVLLWRSFRM